MIFILIIFIDKIEFNESQFNELNRNLQMIEPVVVKRKKNESLHHEHLEFNGIERPFAFWRLDNHL